MRDDRNRFEIPAERRRAIEIPSANMRDRLGLLFDVEPLKTRHQTGIYRIADWYMERAIFSVSDGDPFTVRRTRAQSQAGEPLVFVHRYLRGGLQGRSGDLNIDRQPGAIYVLDQACSVECLQDASLMQSMIIPKAAIGYSPDTHQTLIRIDIGSGIGLTLDGLFDQAFDGLCRTNALEESLIDRLIACLNLAIGKTEAQGDVRRLARNAIADQIRRYIERNLNQWDLSVTSLLRDFGASRASLYRMFEREGGVREYINRRRLLRAVMDISARPIRRGQIADAAERWGFSSSANFNRAVRREFGVAPSTLVNLPVQNRRALATEKGLHRFPRRALLSADRLLDLQMSLHA